MLPRLKIQNEWKFSFPTFTPTIHFSFSIFSTLTACPTKRVFQWQMDRYSYFTMILSLVTTVGTMLVMPMFHHFNVNDNVIILTCNLSCIASRLTRALAKSEQIFFASSAVAILLCAFHAPVRAQITRCVPAQDLGKVNISCFSVGRSRFCPDNTMLISYAMNIKSQAES